MKPTVSICIPTYEQTGYLQKTLDSIIAQTYTDYELIISDDSKSTSVEDLLGKYGFGNKLLYVRNSEPKGSPENWNSAVRLAKGKYIKILHHDDWFKDENSLSIFVEMIEKHPESDFAYCATQNVDENGKLLSLHTTNHSQLAALRKHPEQLLFHNYIGAPSTTIYKREGTLEYDDNLIWLVDIDFYIQTLLCNNNCVYLDKPLICVTSKADHQITRKVENDRFLGAKENLHIYKKVRNAIPFISYVFLLLRLLRSNSLITLVGEYGKQLHSTIPFEIKIISWLKK
ncbi:MAG: hypothetical protein RL641_104 [Candidatus Parcubacteria bacterium]|jgi:glycosyltransferase involved in cell wall biosynthesis